MERNISADDFCRFIWKSYLEERRYDLVNEFVSEKISVIGTGAHEVERNLEEFIASFTEESNSWNGRFVIRDQWYQTTELSDSHSLVMGELLSGRIPMKVFYMICVFGSQLFWSRQRVGGK